MIEIHEGSSNVYADLGFADADGMLLKAKLVTEITDFIKARGWTLQQSADALGFSTHTLAQMQRGHFRDISEAKLRACLARLGRNIHCVVSPEHERASTDHVEAVFAT